MENKIPEVKSTTKIEDNVTEDSKTIPETTQPVSSAIDEDKLKLLQRSTMGLWIDDYNEIFSDFDPRPYSQRALSDDFLAEAKKVSKDKASGKMELKFLIPETKRNRHHETTIKKRLKEYFTKRMHGLKKERKDIIKRSIFFIGFGIMLMLITTFFLYTNEKSSSFITFLIILMEPAGWFFLWEGLGLVVFDVKEKRPDIDFNKKMAQCDISFVSY